MSKTKTYFLFIPLISLFFPKLVFSQYWEELRYIMPPIEYTAINNNEDLIFNSKLSSDIEGLMDSLNYVWIYPKGSKTPIQCLKTKDTIIDIKLLENDAILVFIGRMGNTIGFSGYEWFDSKELRKLLLSTDRGNSWNETDIELEGILKFIERPNGILLITACTGNGAVKGSTEIFKSTNFGATWSRTSWKNGVIVEIKSFKSKLVAIGSDSTLYTSYDDGSNWEIKYKIPGENLYHFRTIQENSKEHWFSLSRYVSSDSGITWLSFSAPQGDSLRQFVVFHNDIIYSLSASCKLYSSSDNGTTWNLMRDISDDIYIEQNLYNLFVPNKLLEFQNNLIIRNINDSLIQYYEYDISNDTLTNIFGDLSANHNSYSGWSTVQVEGSYIILGNRSQKINVLSLVRKRSELDFSLFDEPFKVSSNVIGLHLTKDNIIFQDFIRNSYGPIRYMSRNFGLTWEYVTDSILNGKLFVDNQYGLYSLFKNQIYKSNGDLKFSKLGNPIPDFDKFLSNTYPYCPSDGIFIIGNTSYENYSISFDNCESWSTIPSYEKETRWFNVRKMLFRNNVLYVRNTFNFGKTKNLGESWETIKTLSDYNCLDFDIHSSGNIFTRFYSSYHKSTNDGLSWESIPEVGTGFYGSCTITDKDIIFLNTFHSTDNGNSWINNGKGGTMAFNEDNILVVNYFVNPYALYRFNPITDIHEENISKKILTITPNPATDYIEVSGVVGEVKVYDVLGIEHPATAWHPSREGNVRIDVSALPKGVYFVKVGERVSKFVKM